MSHGSIPYVYSDLESHHHIRLITLHPGELSDNIKISISQVRLLPRDNNAIRIRDRLQELQKTMPPDWTVYETLDKRLFFYYEDAQEAWKLIWHHPDPGFDLTPYKMPIANSEPPHYEALSYTWGSGTSKDVAYVATDQPISGTTSSGLVTILQIGQNLADALRHLRLKDAARTLWVDAVCINQTDEAEKNIQVKRMSTIYECAAEVVVWLGLASPDSSLAMTALGFIASQVVITLDAWIFTAPEAVEPDWCYSRHVLPYDDKTWKAINSLLHRDWFGRVWIVQEIQLARKAVVQCGLDDLSWSGFRDAVVLLWNKTSLSHHISRPRLSFIERLGDPVGPSSPIYVTFHRTGARGCFDKRDLIYGVLGLFPEAFREKITPQYSLPVGDVYMDFVRTHIVHVERLELLQNCQLQGRTIDTPSWVPDYSSKKATINGTMWQFSSGYSASQVTFRRGGILDAMGVHCATVRTVSDSIPNYRHSNADTDVQSTFRDSVAAIYRLARTDMDRSSVGGRESPRDVFARTITGNYLKDRFPETSVLTLDEWKKRLGDESLFGGPLPDEDAEGNLTFQEEYAMSLLLGRTYFTTDEGYIGLGPPSAQMGMTLLRSFVCLIYKKRCCLTVKETNILDIDLGDIIVCFLGCDSPLLLRKTGLGEEGPGFLVVGECFVHELNDSRAFLGPLPPPWRVCWFSYAVNRLGVYRYFNAETAEWSEQDPRTRGGPQSEWEPEDVQRSGDDPFTFRSFRNQTTGELAKSDPNLLSEAIASHGITLRQFSLV